jgi:hypothetical protein
MDAQTLGALVLVSAEWYAIGRLSGLDWPGPTPAAVRSCLYLLGGAFLVAEAQLLLALVGTGFANQALPLLVAAAIALAIRLIAKPNPQSRPQKPQFNDGERLAWAILLILLGAASVRSLLVPESGWDAYSHWGLKALAFTTEGTIADAGTVHEYYPPLVPLLESWFSLQRRLVSIDLMKTIWAVVGSAFAISLAWHLRLSLTNKALAPVFTAAIVLATPQLLDGFWTGQADLALTAYLTLATLAIWQWRAAPDRRWLIQAALFGAACALTKYEGLPRIAVVLLAVLLLAALERCWSRALPALVVAAAVAVAYAPWLAYRALHGIAGSTEHLSQLQPQAVGAMLGALVGVFAGVRTGGALLISALAAVLAGPRLFAPRYRLLTLVVAGQVLATLLAFLVSETAPDVQARTSATRLFEHFLPLALFLAALWLDEVRPIIRPGR